MSNDDMCNSYIKTMKTTMEWAKATKGLLKESNEMTVEKVETMLRDSVQVTLYSLMDSSFWFDTINLRRSTVYIKESQNKNILFSEDRYCISKQCSP